MTILAYPPINLGWPFAILAGLATTAGIGFIQGQIISRLRLPPFVVTLAGLLFWEGSLIWLINNQSPFQRRLDQDRQSPTDLQHRQRHPEPHDRLDRARRPVWC